ncbi:MAG: MBOAT family O-acyltransferase, partial [Clostridium sp.]
MSWNIKYAILLMISTVITYLSGILISNADKINNENMKKKKKKLWLVLSIVSNLGILFFFKYFNFVIGNINVIFNKFNIEIINKGFDIVLPVGISFYTLQALSYVIDVYRGDVKV